MSQGVISAGVISAGVISAEALFRHFEFYCSLIFTYVGHMTIATDIDMYLDHLTLCPLDINMTSRSSDHTSPVLTCLLVLLTNVYQY